MSAKNVLIVLALAAIAVSGFAQYYPQPFGGNEPGCAPGTYCGPEDGFGAGVPGGYGQPMAGPDYGGGYGQEMPGPPGGGFGFGGGPMFDMPVLPPEFPARARPEDIMFERVGEAIFEQFSYEELAEMCPETDAIVEKVFSYLQSSEKLAEICTPIEEGITRCEEAKSFCEGIGQEIGPGEDFRMTCPFSGETFIEYCTKTAAERMQQEKEFKIEEINDRCGFEWEMNKERCEMEQITREQWQQPQPFAQPGEWQPPWQPQQPEEEWRPESAECGPLEVPQTERESCAAGGGTIVTEPADCPRYFRCIGVVEQPQPSPACGDTMCVAPEDCASCPVDCGQCQPAPEPETVPAPEEGGAIAPSPKRVLEAFSTLFSVLSFQWGMPEQSCAPGTYCGPGPAPDYIAPPMQGPGMPGPSPDCMEETFLERCKSRGLKMLEFEFSEARYKKMCSLEAKRMAWQAKRFCAEIERGKSDCLEHTQRACDFMQEQLEKCREKTSPEKLKEFLKAKANQVCAYERWKAAPTKYSRTLEIINNLDQSAYYVGGELRPVIAAESTRVMDAIQGKEQIEEAEAKKDFGYQFTKFFGMQKEKELQEAVEISEQVAKLEVTIDNLETISEQVQEPELRAALQQNIDSLDAEVEELKKRFEDKVKGAAGIFGIFGGNQQPAP